MPNVFLQAPLMSTGTWNSAHFNNPTYDGLVISFIASLDMEALRGIAGQIQTLLLDEAPLIQSYFYDFMSFTKAGNTGVVTTAMGLAPLDHRRSGSC